MINLSTWVGLRMLKAWLSILSVSALKVFLEEISIWIELMKVDGPPQCGGHHPVHGGLEQNKKMEEGWMMCSLPGFLNRDIDLLLPLELMILMPPDLNWRLHHWLSCSQAFLGLQLGDNRLWDFSFSVSIIVWANQHLKRIFFFLCVSMLKYIKYIYI